MQPTRGFIEQLSRWEEKMFGSKVTDVTEPEYQSQKKKKKTEDKKLCETI